MIAYLFQKLGYGVLVLLGVITLVFFLFNLAPGDPVRNLVGENASQETVANMRRKFDLDLPVPARFVLYVNDLSPLAIHSSDSTSRAFFDQQELSGFKILPVGKSWSVYLKSPYLKRSFLSDKSVAAIIGEVLPGTFVLAFVSIFLAMIVGLILGIFAALEKDTFWDRLILFTSALGMAGPSFFVAMLVAWLGAIVWREQIALPYSVLLYVILLFFLLRKSTLKFGTLLITRSWLLTLGLMVGVAGYFMLRGLPSSSFLRASLVLPGTGLSMTGSLYGVDVWRGEFLDLRNMILPVITLMIRPLSVIVQLTRSSLLDVLQQDFIRTARAKGLSEFDVIVRHGLRNALNPVITAVSGWFASLLAGAIFVEFVFGWKGLGQQMFTAIENQDLPVVMGGVIVISMAFVVINLLVDILYGWIDPRVRIS
ncbi:MAG: ABC transporter permease [Flavobacteriales bacterium]